MSDPYNLQRFVDAQSGTLDTALAELKAGQKQSHWMWFVFPQIACLGSSPTSRHYAIASLDEARAYLAHPELGPRLAGCVEAIMAWSSSRSAEQMFGAVDAAKLRSSLTLFELAHSDGPYAAALEAFFGGQRDSRTIALLRDAR